MNWNQIPNDQKLQMWRELRDGIKDKNLYEQLSEIAKFCSTIPFGSRTLDYYSSEEWPTPWEILFHGTFCTSSISLLMAYTMLLLQTKSDIELRLVEDENGLYLLPVFDNQFVLNYELGTISNYPDICDNFKVLQIISRDKIKNIT
jgi:hypothetical protein